MESIENCRNQIIANLIDYNDGNSNAKTDNANNPTYVGLEKVPYINELKLEVEAEVEFNDDGFFVNDVLYIRGSGNKLSKGHVNGDISFSSSGTYINNTTNGAIITYVGSNNQPANNDNFLTEQVGTTQTQMAMPGEPAEPAAIPALTVPPYPTLNYPAASLPKPDRDALRVTARANGTFYRNTYDFYLTMSGTDQIRISRGNGNEIDTVSSGSIIYLNDSTEHIYIDEDNFDRTVTLVTHRNNSRIYIRGDNITLRPSPSANNIQIFSNDDLFIEGNNCELNGVVYARDELNIRGDDILVNGNLLSNDNITIGYSTDGPTGGLRGSYTGYLWAKDYIYIRPTADNSSFASLYSSREDVRIYADSASVENIYADDDTLINGGYATVNTINSNDETNINSTFCDIGDIFSNGTGSCTNINAIGCNIDSVFSNNTTTLLADAGSCTIGDIKNNDDLYIRGPLGNNVIGRVETTDLVEVGDSDTVRSSNNTIESVNSGTFIIYGDNNTIGDVECDNASTTIGVYGSYNTLNNVNYPYRMVVGRTSGVDTNNTFTGTIWGDADYIRIYGSDNTFNTIKSGLDTELRGGAITVTNMIWSGKDILFMEPSVTLSIGQMVATKRVRLQDPNIVIENCSLVWTGDDIRTNGTNGYDLYLMDNCSIIGAQISCGGTMAFYGSNIDISTTSNYTANVTLKDIDLELVNMYDEAELCQAALTVEGSYNWILGGADSEVNFSKNLIFTNISATDKAYTIATNSASDSDISPSSVLTSSAGQTTSIEDFDLSKITVKLTYGYNLYDFSFFDDNTGVTDDTITADGTKTSYYYDYQVNDPRQNLLVSDWLKEGSSSLSIGTIGTKNSNCIPQGNGVDSDLETATEPWGVSTAYIRNAPMQSPWELGFIHRGDTWQTINLKKYNSTEGMTGGGDTYSDGDANILDQVKMTSDTETYGKINVNSDIEEVINVLFEKIRVGSNIASAEGPGTLLKADDSDADVVTFGVAQTLSTAMLTNSGAISEDSTKHFYTRAQILRNTEGVPELYDNSLGLSQTTDATQEEIIGKFINLTTAVEQLPDQFSVIVVAQTIKDNGGGITIKKRVDGVNRTIPNIQTGTYDQYADDLLSTQIIQATVRRDPTTNKFYIVDYEYID